VETLDERAQSLPERLCVAKGLRERLSLRVETLHEFAQSLPE
jgi:hypothetical protein